MISNIAKIARYGQESVNECDILLYLQCGEEFSNK